MKFISTPFMAGAMSAVMLVSLACRQVPNDPVALVVICDLSASVEPEARESMFSSLEAVTHQLRRGDAFTIIPATGDTEAEAPGRVLRFQIPIQREVYDEDRHAIVREAQAAIERFAAKARTMPTSYTDLLGTMRLIQEEASSAPGQRLVVVILSDFIQDDRRFNFMRDPALSTPERAGQLATQLAEGQQNGLQDVPVYLGFIASSDFKRLGQQRRNAIREFWHEYLVRHGAAPEFATDGPGLMQRFLERSRGKQKHGSEVTSASH